MSLVVLTVVALLVFALATIYRGAIPTPVPEHIGDRARQMRRGPVWLTAYRVGLVVLFVLLGGLALVYNPGGLVAFFLAGVLIWAFMEDIQKTILDVWNADFEEIELNTNRTPRWRR
jgi:hypothetical protein